MKIKKYQYGATYTPISREPIGAQSEQKAASSASPEDKKTQLIESQIVQVLGENGIPTDVDYFLSQAESFLQDSTNIFSSGKTNTMSQLIRLRSLANRVKYNRDLYNTAVDRLKSENTGSDVAITSEGDIWAIGDEGVVAIRPETYYNNQDKYKALTNYQLLHIREEGRMRVGSGPNDYIPLDLHFKEEILNDISNSIGMKTVMTQVIDTIKKMGTQNQSGYGTKLSPSIAKGFEHLMNAGPDGLYEIERTNPNAMEDISKALSYLYRNLNDSSKNVLKATVAAEGLAPNAENVAKILLDAVIEHTSGSVGVKYVKDPEGKKSGSGSGSDGTGSMVKETWGDFVTKNGGSRAIRSFVLPGTNVEFSFPAWRYNSIGVAGKEGETMHGPALASDLYQNLSGHALVDASRKAYFGDLAITNPSLQGRDILIDSDQGGWVVYLPTTNDGNIDFSMFKQISEIQQEIVSNRVTSTEEKRKIWEDNGFQYNEQLDCGVPIYEQLTRYWVQPGHSSTAAKFFEKRDLKQSEFLSKENENLIRNLGQVYNMSPDVKKNGQIDLSTWLKLGTAFGGAVFIPIQENQNETLVIGGAAYMPKPQTDMIKAQQDALISVGQYNYITGAYNRALKGTTAGDLD